MEKAEKGILSRMFGGSGGSASDEPWSRFADLYQELENAVDGLLDLSEAGNNSQPMDASVVSKARSEINGVLDRMAQAVADYNRGLEQDRQQQNSDARPLSTKAGAHAVYK